MRHVPPIPSRPPGARAARPRAHLPSWIGAAALLLAAGALFLAEKRWRLRAPPRGEPARTLRNLALGAASLAVVQVVQRPLVEPLAERVARERLGLSQAPPLPAWARDALAFALLDYTIYAWHVLTHRVPFLWRFHVVHHADADMDMTTALRFHAADMLLSVPWRALQVRACGASPRALEAWQRFFFASVLLHHSNLRLPLALERRLVRVLTTPRLHGIHHSVVREETDSNWSSGLSVWDWLHGTIRVDVPQDRIEIGVPRWRGAATPGLAASLALPFGRQPDAWRTRSGARIERAPTDLGDGVFPG